MRAFLHHYTPVNQQLLEQPRVSTEFGKQLFSYLTPKTWNSLRLKIDFLLYWKPSNTALKLTYSVKQ